MSSIEVEIAQQRHRDAFGALLDALSEERVRKAYEHGFHAGASSVEVDRLVYRRGYFAGYAAGRRGGPSHPDGTAPGGRPRKLTVGGR